MSHKRDPRRIFQGMASIEGIDGCLGTYIGGKCGGCSKVLVKEGPLGIHFLKKGILTKQGTYIMAILGTGILNNYHVNTQDQLAVVFWYLGGMFWEFPKIRGTILGVPIIRTIVFWGLYWGPLILGNSL